MNKKTNLVSLVDFRERGPEIKKWTMKYIKNAKNKFCVILFIICAFLILAGLFVSFSNPVFAQGGISITPVIIDTKAEARDILEYSVKLTNLNRDSKVTLYPIVNDISVKEGKQEFLDPSLADKSTSLARWIRISRAKIDLLPGQEKEISFKIEVNLNARPGKYYARILFSHGSTRAEAEAQASLINRAELIVKLTIEEHIVEKAQIKQFRTERNISWQSPVKFFLEIENIGNRAIVPRGSVRIYDRRGREVGAFDINPLQADILPVASNLFEKNWQVFEGIGQYRAVLIAEYGNKKKGDLRDTIFFWVLPWTTLAFWGGGILILLVGLLIVVFKAFHRQPPQKFYQPDKVIDLRKPIG